MERLCDQLLACSAFPLNKDCGPAGSDLRNEIEDAQHPFALANDVGEAVALLQCALELDVLLFGMVAAYGRANVGKQLLVVPRLLDEVLRARADGVHNVVHFAVGGDHDDWKGLVALADERQDLKPALAWKREV